MSNPKSNHPLSNRQLSVDLSRESIKRQISAITPVRVVFGQTQQPKLAEDIEAGRRRAYESEGVMGLIECTKDAEYLALIMARLNYGIANITCTDLASGLYSAYTRGETFAEEPRRLVDQKTGDIVKTVFTLSHEAIWKLMLGPLVNNRGRATHGAGPVVGQIKDQMLPILLGLEAEPTACSSIQRTKPDGHKIQAVVFGKPLIIDKWTTNAARIMLDHHFFPVFESEAKAGDKYLNQVAGLGAFLSFGRYLRKQRGESGFPQTPEAHRLIMSVQAAFELRGFAPGIVHEKKSGRNNVTFRRSAIKTLRPKAIETNGRINFREVTDFVSNVGKMYREALDETGIEDQLPEKVLIPATQKGAEFPEKPDNVVYIKVDRLK